MHSEKFFDRRDEERSLEVLVGELGHFIRLFVHVVLDLFIVESSSVKQANLSISLSKTNEISLFRKVNSLKILVLSQSQNCPCTSSSTGVLSSHQQSDHDVCDLFIGQRFSISVSLVLKCSQHVEIGLEQTRHCGEALFGIRVSEKGKLTSSVEARRFSRIEM